MEYIFGKNTIDSFIGNDMLLEVYLLPSFDDKKIIDKLKNNNIKTTIKDKGFFDKFSNGIKHQGIAGKIKDYEYYDLDDITNSSRNYPFIVVLDGIEDPHNLGAIIRTCEAFKVDGIIISKNNCCPVNATVAKVSTGAIANVKICQVTNITQTLKALKKKGYWVYMAEAYNSQDYDKVDYKNPVVLVVGSEGFGISRLVKEQADFNIAIRQYGKVNSLNVSVATGILISYISIQHN